MFRLLCFVFFFLSFFFFFWKRGGNGGGGWVDIVMIMTRAVFGELKITDI